MGVTGDLLNRILKTAGRKVDLATYKDGIIDCAATANENKRQRTSSRRPLRMGLDVGTLVARAAHGFGSMLLDERHLTNYGRSLLHEEAAAGADPRQQMTSQENRREYVDRCTAYVLKRIHLLKEASGAQLLVVFDGATPPIKAKECLVRSDKRKEAAKQRDEPLDEGEEANVNSKRRVRAARRAGAGKNHCDILVEVMMALRREQIPFMVAPYEADGQLAYFQSEMKMLDVVATEDSDLIAHGCHSILYKTAEELGKGSASGILVQRGDLSAKGLVPKCLSLVDFSDVMLAVMFVALGCDYCSSLKQIGSVAARDIVRDAFHGENRQSEEDCKRPALEKTFERLYEKTSAKDLTDEFKQEYEASFLAALLMYRHPMIYDPFVKECVLLRNPPHGSDPELMDYKPYADLCSDVKRREEILGTCHGSVISTRIAEGWLNPRTKRPYENMAIPSKIKDVPLSLSASDSDSEEETQAQTQDMPPKPARHATETAVEDPETQDDYHVETQLGTPSPAQNRSERQSVQGHETHDNSRFETQPGTQDSWPPSEEIETSSDSHIFTMTFETKKLGIILSETLAVQSVTNKLLEKTLKNGDTLVAINGSRVGNAALGEIQEQLNKEPRPVKLTFFTPPKPARHATETAVEDSETQDDHHMETQLGTPSPVQNRAERQSVQGHERHDNSRFETQPGTQDSWPPSKEMETSTDSHTFTISFETKKLGILLSGTLGACNTLQFAVQSVTNKMLGKGLKNGDTLVAINGSRVGNASLGEIQERLNKVPRPVKVTFSRPIVAIDKSAAAVVDLTQDDSPRAPVARLPAVETTQTSASSASRLASQPSQPSTGSQISAEVSSPNLL